jgi:hypothetical protein
MKRWHSWRNTATCSRASRVRLSCASGRQFALTGIDNLHMTDDKIAELWRSFDIRALIQRALIQQLTSD